MKTNNFTWIDFYTKFANKLLQYKHNRSALVQKLTLIFNNIGKEIPKLSNNEWKDIDPFTVYALFNRYMTDQNRSTFIENLIQQFNIDAVCPKDFTGIPVVQNLNCAFYRFDDNPENEINSLWEMFEKALQYADNKTEETQTAFLSYYNKVKDNKGLKFKLSMGLYWIRPYFYMGLDDRNKQLIINLEIFKDAAPFLYRRSGTPTAEEYIRLRDKLLDTFEKEEVKYHNFPELSTDAYYVFEKKEKQHTEEKNCKENLTMTQIKNIPLNQILYGPPGTGKTYNTIIEAMKIMTFEELFRDWYLKVYCLNNKVDSKEKVLGDYIKTLKKINEEFLINDNIFIYYEKEQFIPLKNYILNSQYITEDSTKNNKNSYYQHALKRYEEFLMWLDYDKIKEKFNEYKALGQIEFVTFHQSYSYEEFVEGIKPDLNSNELKYNLKKGCFRLICDSVNDLHEEKTTHKFDYNNLSLYKILMPVDNLFEYCIENDCVAMGWGSDINVEKCSSEDDIAKMIPENYEHRNQCLSQLNIFKLWIDKDLKEGKDVIAIIPGSINTIKGIAKITGNYSYNEEIEYGHQQRKAEWIKKDINVSSEYIYSSKFVAPTITGMYKNKINENNLLKLLNNTVEQKSQNAVLIIDEINRGNISKIFGELITLIEEDKREELSVRLPYSQDPFTVPKNLYIIGTMNTSDRSIASIDIALRRRFKFVEMMPRSDLVADFGIGFKGIFEDLNNKIKLLLDREHQIGHSYFINTKYNDDKGNNNIEVLKEIWFSEILPLLNEYFYGDWDRLKLIIPGFIKELNVPKALNDACDDSMYEFKTFDEVSNFEDALKQEKFE